jgi:transcriptional regulator with XRE-family HTH domain
MFKIWRMIFIMYKKEFFMNDAELKILFGKKIKALREKSKMSQEELSEKLDITQRQVSMIERGLSFPKLHTLNKLSNVFSCHVMDLFDNEHLQSEQFLKASLNEIISTSNYEKIKTIYLVAKNL